MRLPEIQLDDRRFQELVSEARTRISRACPEWTEHNVSDPGITLIELFAWMTEMTIYRLNRVPDKLHVTLLDLLGIRLDGPSAATTSLRRTAAGRSCGVIATPAAVSAARRHSASVAPGGTARIASANRPASTSSPPNRTSRLSAKCRKNVARFNPARSAICATVVSSKPFSTNRSSAASSRRSRAFGAHLLTVTS